MELDAIRTAGTLIVGAGGAAALLLAARRQRSTELTLEHQRETLEHQREVALAAERDAAEQRLTELYTRAVDQLGAEKAPARLGGLHALERLAQNNPDQRQTIVDVICAYLRMPYTSPDDQASDEDASEDAHRRYEQRRQELQVRLTAQRILAAHLRPEVKAAFWVDIDLNLTEAHLYQLDLIGCHVRTARFDGATFTKTARFDRAKFAGNAWFDGAEFAGDAGFDGAEFAGDVGFEGTEFVGDGVFLRTNFAGNAGFEGAKFAGDAGFGGTKFAGYARFDKANFAGMRGLPGRSSPGMRGSSGRTSLRMRGSRGRSSPGRTQSLMARVCPRTPFTSLCRRGGRPVPRGLPRERRKAGCTWCATRS